MDGEIRVVLTGGEPLLQVDDSLITALKKENILNQLEEIKKKYQTLSNQYQQNKDGNSIPLN